MAYVVHRQRGSSRSAKEGITMFQPPDLRQVTVLRKAEWQRIQDEMNQIDRNKERIKEAAKQREAMHLQSQEMVKLWSNTITGQRKKKLEAKKIREQIEEEKRKQIDFEEATYKEQKRKEAIEKAKAQLYYQTDRVKAFHRAVLLTEVLKEREAQIELKQRVKSASKDTDKIFLKMAKTKEEEALKQEQEAALCRKLERQAVVEDLKKQINENELTRQRQRLEDLKKGEEIQRLRALHQQQDRMESAQAANKKRELSQSYQEHLTNRDLMKAKVAQKEEAEDKQRELFLAGKQKMMKLWKEKEKELFRESQEHKDRAIKKLAAKKQEQTASEEQKIAKAVAEQDAKQALLLWEEEERRTAMMKSIVAHREQMRQEKEQREKLAQQQDRDAMEAKKEADRIFSEKQQLKVKKIREEERKLKDFLVSQMAEKSARREKLSAEECQFKAKSEALMAEGEMQFQQYSQQIISAAAGAQRNVYPLCKAAREGVGGGHGPLFGGFRHSYLVQDRSDTQMPKYVSSATETVKKLNEAVNIQEAKRRLGFSW
ncbi:coiled-coil domain-containing protein 173 [Parambassis ranga]|uniref:Coiled-coil domain-containing protein 173 n=1 Tax=Parambassis ranga TaxID=210632 RepID=A0A6P7HMW1_9TELE|nr:coiled-coil domain-containing protein 173 [Parambassis ranga]